MDEVRYDLSNTERKQTTIDMESIIRRIVDEKTHEVTDVVHLVRSLLKDDTDQLTDLEIDDILLKLPIVLYDAIDEQEVVGLQLDMAKQIYKEAQSGAYKLARGTIADKNAVTDLATRAEQLEQIIYDRSYKIIKQKFEMAVETLNAVKKVQASRQQRYELGNMRSRF